MKVRYRRFFLVLAVLATLMVSACSFPDYQLEFQITTDLGGTGSVDVQYYLENVGTKDLYDVTIDIAIRNTLDFTFIESSYPIDLSVGEVSYGTLHFSSTGTVSPGTAKVIRAGWDTDDSMF